MWCLLFVCLVLYLLDFHHSLWCKRMPGKNIIRLVTGELANRLSWTTICLEDQFQCSRFHPPLPTNATHDNLFLCNRCTSRANLLFSPCDGFRRFFWWSKRRRLPCTSASIYQLDVAEGEIFNSIGSPSWAIFTSWLGRVSEWDILTI